MSTNQKLRIVLVGAGGMSRVWLTAALSRTDIEIVAIVDVIAEAAQKRANEYNLTRTLIGTDLQTILEQVQADAVFNCTIPEAHYDVTMLALNHGCHVLTEKPLANSMAQAQEMVNAAERAGKIISVIQNRRYDANIRRVHSFLQGGTLGTLTTINSDFYLAPHFGGFRDHMPHVLLLDMAIHTFDAARLLIGADPISVYCQEWNPAGSWYDHDASAIAIFEMNNGVVYTYRGSWCADGLPTTWEAEWRIIGQQGTLLWHGDEEVRAQVIQEKGGFISNSQDIAIPPYQSGRTGAHAGIIDEFLTCIQQGTQPETTAADNIKSLAMVFGAITSAEQGRKIMLQ